MHCCFTRLVYNVVNHNVRSVLCARAQTFVDKVCRAGPSDAGRRAKGSNCLDLSNTGILSCYMLFVWILLQKTSKKRDYLNALRSYGS